MYLFHLFRSFLPLRNPIGFGAADFVVFAIALLVALILVLHRAIGNFAAPFVRRPITGFAVLASLSILLRLALIHSAPVPVPAGADDFSYLLLADTLGHLRFANPTHALHQFFEAVFILQQPTYSSIYPAGQGIVLAIGKSLLGSYWAGVLVSSAALVALCYWMLRGWTTPRWAFVGGLLAVIEFGPLCSWTNSYWGGAVSACAGCLVFGALPRLGLKSRRNALLLGIGLAIQLLTRPFEFLLLAVSVFLYLLLIARFRRSLLLALLPLLCAVALTGLQNKSVTGEWTTLPYMLSRYQYGVPATFTFQPNPVPHHALTQEQDLDYRAQAAIHGPGTDTAHQYFSRLLVRLSFTRFFLLSPLFVAVVFLVPHFRERRWVWLLVTIGLFFAGTNFYPYFFPHYIAAVLCLFVLAALGGLASLASWNRHAAVLLLSLCGAHFLFWYAIHLSNDNGLLQATEWEAWDFVNHGDPEGRIAVAKQLAQQPGKQLVFVRYGPQHRFAEWIHNAADIDGSRVVWAIDLGEAENQKLIQYFPSRTRWLLAPDRHPVELLPYPAE